MSIEQKDIKVYNLFFSEKNYYNVMGVIYEHINENYDFTISEEEETLCSELMKYIYTNSKPREPSTSPINYTKALNREIVNQLIDIISNKIHDNMVSDKHIAPVNILERPQNQNTNKPQNIEILPRKTGNDFGNVITNNKIINKRGISTSYPGNNDDILTAYSELTKNRNIELQKSDTEVNTEIPNFQESLDNNNKEIKNFFDKEIQSRKYSSVSNDVDITGPPQNVLYSEIPNDSFKTEYDIPPQPSSLDLVIEKPKQDKTSKDYYLVIDSRDRNYDKHPSPSEYIVNFGTIYKDILSIELISAEIPHSGYVINTSNNVLHFQETLDQQNNNTYYEAVIKPGNYSVDELKTEIQTKMIDVGASEYTITVDTISRKFTIISDLQGGIFNLGFRDQIQNIYKKNSIGNIIGFSRSNFTNSNTYISNYQYNLNGERYILLNILNLENLVGVSSTVKNSFGKITLSSDVNGIRYFSTNDYLIKKLFLPPLAKLDNFNIKFAQYDGSLYDFGGLEHSLSFKITTLLHLQEEDSI